MFIHRNLSRAVVHKQGRHTQPLSQLRTRRREQRGDFSKEKEENAENADNGRQPAHRNHGTGEPVDQWSYVHRPHHVSES